MRVCLRYIAAGLVLAACLVLQCASIEPGTVPVAHAQRHPYHVQPNYQPPPSRINSSDRPMGCGAVGGAPLVILLLVLTFTGKPKGRTAGGGYEDYYVDVTVLRVAVDWRERKFLKGKLDDIARSVDAGLASGRKLMLRESTAVLRRARDAWRYAGIVNAEPIPAPAALARFRQHAEDPRPRFREELIRNAGGPTGTIEARVPGPEAGDGFVVITLIVAARGTLLDFHDMADPEEVRRCLESLGNLPTSMLTEVEIVWSPAAEHERLSAAELERLYPEMQKIRGGWLGWGSRCASCDGPLPAELVSCPHCGAHVSEQAAS
jgi:uncharacterized membrane protein